MGVADPLTGEKSGMPWEFYRWRLAKEYGWSLEYVDSLPMGALHEWFQIEDALNKYHEARKAGAK